MVGAPGALRSRPDADSAREAQLGVRRRIRARDVARVRRSMTSGCPSCRGSSSRAAGAPVKSRASDKTWSVLGMASLASRRPSWGMTDHDPALQNLERKLLPLGADALFHARTVLIVGEVNPLLAERVCTQLL